MAIQVKEGGTSLNKTFRKYNLVFKGLITSLYDGGPVVASAGPGEARVQLKTKYLNNSTRIIPCTN